MDNDRKDFYRITKPIKFRAIKSALKETKAKFTNLGNKLSHLKNKIYYLYNYILYRLHIYNRFTHKESTVQTSVPPKDFIFRTIETTNFSAEVVANYEVHTDVDMDYFYREKAGVKFITHVLKDNVKYNVFLVVRFHNIRIFFKNTWYNTFGLPVLKVSTFSDDNDKCTEVKSFNIDRIVSLYYKIQVSYNPTYMPEELLRFHYDSGCRYLLNSLRKITLDEIEVKR